MEKFDSILRLLKRASIFQIFVLSFVLLPYVFQAWLKIFQDLGYEVRTIEKSLGAVCLLYVLFLALMLFDANRKRRRD